MCGRFVAAAPPEEIATYFEADVVADGLLTPGGWDPSYNVPPTSDVLVVRDRFERRETSAPASEPDRRVRLVDSFRWGLVPHWADDLRIGARLVNARAETAASKPAFADALVRHRCLVPAAGFFEWQRRGGVPQPFFIHSVDGLPLAFAGLWATWSGTVGGIATTVRSVAILTRAANGDMASIHDRMPVLVERDAWTEWLQPGRLAPEDAADLLAPPADGTLAMHPVSRAVGNVANDHPGLIDPVSDPPAQVSLFD